MLRARVFAVGKFSSPDGAEPDIRGGARFIKGLSDGPLRSRMGLEEWKKYLQNLHLPGGLFDIHFIDKLRGLVKNERHHEAYDYIQFIQHLDRYGRIYEMLGILKRDEKDELDVALGGLKRPFINKEPKALSRDNFFRYVRDCEYVFKQAAERIGRMAVDGIEYIRINEGIDCFLREIIIQRYR